MTPQKAPRGLWVLFVSIAALSAGNGVVFPLLAKIQDAHHLPTYGLGLMSGATFAAGLATQLTLARFADRGYSRVLLLVGLAGSVVSLMLLASADSLWQFVFARALEGLAFGCFGPAARSVIVASYPESPGRHLGILSSFDVGGFVLSPILGTPLANTFTLVTPFYTLAGVALVALLLIVLLGVPPVPEFASPPKPWTLLRRRPVVAMLLLGFAVQLPIGIYDPLWARIFTDRGASSTFISVSVTLFGIPFLLFGSIGGRIADRIGPMRTVLMCQFVSVPCISLYGLLHRPGHMAAVGILEGVVAAASIPAGFAAMAAVSPKNMVGAAQGLYGACGLLAAGSVSLVSPMLYRTIGPGKLLVGAAITVASLVVISWRISASALRQSVTDEADLAPADSDAAADARLSVIAGDYVDGA
jgi:DHA1 family multidrug resistance protein-like MFS transporter